MPIQPWFVSQTSPAWTLTLSVPNNPLAPDLTGLTPSSLSLIVVDTATNAVSSGFGSFTSIASYVNPAVVVYQPNAADPFVVNANGKYRLYVQVTYANGPDIFGPYNFTTTQL